MGTGGFRGPTRGHTRGPTRGVKFRGSLAPCFTEQMDAEGLGHKLLLTPAAPRKFLKSKLWVVCTASHKMLTCKHFRVTENRVLSMPALPRKVAWAEERFSGDLWQSVPQNSSVHLPLETKILLSIFEKNKSL